MVERRRDGDWSYATVAASGLSVPAGGAVALAWQSTPERVPPDVPAPVAADGQPATAAGSSDAADNAASDDSASDSASGSALPAWVGPVAVLALAAVAAVAFLVRRRARSG